MDLALGPRSTIPLCTSMSSCIKTCHQYLTISANSPSSKVRTKRKQLFCVLLLDSWNVRLTFNNCSDYGNRFPPGRKYLWNFFKKLGAKVLCEEHIVCAPQISSSSTRELVRHAHSWAPSQTYESEALRVGICQCSAGKCLTTGSWGERSPD